MCGKALPFRSRDLRLSIAAPARDKRALPFGVGPCQVNLLYNKWDCHRDSGTQNPERG